MKKLLAIILAIILTLSLTAILATACPACEAAAEAVTTEVNDDEIRVILDGEQLAFDDVPPQIIDNRTMVPMRAIFEAWGAELVWFDDASSIAEIVADFAWANVRFDFFDWTQGSPIIWVNMPTSFPTVVLQVDSKAMLVWIDFDDGWIELDVPPQIVDNRTLVPLRAISEALNAEVDWCGDTRTVTIETPTVSDESNGITVHIPRELFFTGGSEEGFLEFFEEVGRVIAELADDNRTFWANQRENAGTINISVSFSNADRLLAKSAFEEELSLIFDSIVNAFDSIQRFEAETTETYARFVFTVDVEEFGADRNVIELLDFVFPYVGQVEYLLRIFSLYDMTNLERIVFYIEDSNTSERTEIYSFFEDAPLGLSMRHI